MVEAGRGADGSVATVWGGSGCPPEYTDRLHHYAGALCAAAAEDGLSYSVFYVVQAAPGSVGQELADQMAAAGWRQEVIDGYAAGGAPCLDSTATVFGQVYEGMETVDAIGAAGGDGNQAPVEPITLHSVTIETHP